MAYRTVVIRTCPNCREKFQKLWSEVKRRKRDHGQTRFYCSKSCQVSAQNRADPNNGNPQNLRPDNRRDRLTEFRWFMARIRYRGLRGRGPTNLTVHDLQTVWARQGGKCPLTGWKIRLPTSTRGWEVPSPKNASVDRIDHARGYVRGNIRFVAVMANFARNKFSDKEVVEFARAVARHIG